MYVEKDNNGKIIIQDISQAEAEILSDCLHTYLLGENKAGNDVDKIVIKLKNGLENNIENAY